MEEAIERRMQINGCSQRQALAAFLRGLPCIVPSVNIQ
jgi:hypothetical protein